MTADTLPAISFETLRERAIEAHTPSSARTYTAMLNRLEAYTGADTLDLRQINPSFVAGFGDYLIRAGVRPSSVALFQKAFRATLRSAYGSGHRADFRAAFAAIRSANDTTATRAIDLDDLSRLTAVRFPGEPYLAKILDLFLYATFGGGLMPAQLKNLTHAEIAGANDHQALILRRFPDLPRFAASLPSDRYATALSVIGERMQLPHPLLPESAADAWIAAGVAAGVSHDLIAATLADPSRLSAHLITADVAPVEDLDSVRRTICDRIIDLRDRWYAMRCTGCVPADIDRMLHERGILRDSERLDSFIVPESPAPSGGHKVPRPILSDMLFFRISRSRAAAIARALRPEAWVYTSAGTGEPSPIADTEMFTFMLLCDIAQDTIDIHFGADEPTAPDLQIGQEALITNGNFTGHIGIITSLPPDRYRVTLTLTTLFATITATVPANFLQPLD